MFDLSKLEQRALLLPFVRMFSNISGNPQMDSGSVKGAAGNCRRNSVEGAAGNCRQDIVQNRVQNPKTYSQVWKGDNQSRRSYGKLQHCDHDHVTHDGRSCGKLQRDNAQGALPDSSEVPRETAGRTVQGNMARSSRGCGKLQQKIEIQLQTTRLDHHNLRVTDYGNVEKVFFMNLRRKLHTEYTSWSVPQHTFS